MSELAWIRTFLASVRRRCLLESGLRAGGVAVAALAAALLILALAAARVGPASFWPAVTALVLVVGVLAGLVLGVIRPAATLRSDGAVARFVGRAHPPLASDLVSAVELGADFDRIAGQDRVSPALVHALAAQVMERAVPLHPSGLVPMRAAGRAGLAAGLAAAMLLAAVLGAPRTVGRGLSTLLRRPTRFEGAAVSTEPIVGEVRISYVYPGYSGLPPRVIDGSTGDIVAVKGTHVRLSTRALRPAARAMLLLGDAGERGEIPAVVQDGVITAELTLQESGSYRFWLAPTFGRPVREARSHRLDAEDDRPPRVEIFGPADRLELPAPRPLEVGYAASDDFGVGPIDLVYRIGDAPEERVRLRQASDTVGVRAAEGRTVWDPAASAGPAPGERISYRIEAADLDAVSGAKVGSSRTLYVVIQNPRESIEDRLQRQREILERLIGDLADRLETGEAQKEPAPAGADLALRVGVFAALQDAQEAHVALLGRLLDDDRQERGMGKALRAALSGIADRLGRLLREEAGLIRGLRARIDRGPLSAGAFSPIEAASVRHVAELEKDVLLLDDLLGRQRLEDLAAVGRELTEAHQRLKDLLARYAATRDEALKRQIERELRDLRARIGELAEKIAALKLRHEVNTEWQNMPDTSEAAERARELERSLAKGDQASAERMLSELGRALDGLRGMLDSNLGAFRDDHFSTEDQAMAEVMKAISDLEGDERGLASETQGLAEKQKAEMAKRMVEKLDGFLRQAQEKVERLRRKVAGLRADDLDGDAGEDVARAKESVKQLKRLLSERDLAEATGEAERAESSLGRAGDALEEAAGIPDGDETSKMSVPGSGPRAAATKRAAEIAEASGLAAEIAADLRGMLPRPGEMLSPAEREAARAQSERQEGIGQRTDETARQAARRAAKVPGLDRTESELRASGERMRQAAEHLRRGEAQQALGAERDAADRLAKLRAEMEKERQLGRGKTQREPVRIPGADDSKAPREWRQELLEAMKEPAPERFRDDVRRYYEELVR